MKTAKGVKPPFPVFNAFHPTKGIEALIERWDACVVRAESVLAVDGDAAYAAGDRDAHRACIADLRRFFQMKPR